ncbi:hypothetical protein BHE74_00041158 [Ensete ventricosum]|nr:hypothetical protein BHE74_00041158 [Ensete ventricosum]
MARPLVGAATHGQAGCRGSRLWPRLPARGHFDAHWQLPARAASHRWPPVETVARRGSSHSQARTIMASPQRPTSIIACSMGLAGATVCRALPSARAAALDARMAAP